MGRGSGGAARRRRLDHQCRAARRARGRFACDLRDAGARCDRRDLQGEPPLVALATSRGGALVRSLARERPRAGRGRHRADRPRLSRRRFCRRDGCPGMVDPGRPRRSRGPRRRARLGDAHRAERDDHARDRPPPPRRRNAAAESPTADFRLRANGLAGPACARAAGRRRGGTTKARGGRDRRHRGVRLRLPRLHGHDERGRSDGACSGRASVRRC